MAACGPEINAELLQEPALLTRQNFANFFGRVSTTLAAADAALLAPFVPDFEAALDASGCTVETCGPRPALSDFVEILGQALTETTDDVLSCAVSGSGPVADQRAAELMMMSADAGDFGRRLLQMSGTGTIDCLNACADCREPTFLCSTRGNNLCVGVRCAVACF